MKKFFSTVIFILVLLINQTFAQSNIQDLLKNIQDKNPNSLISFSMTRSTKTPDIQSFFSYPLIPASTLKTITSATALEVLGENFTYKTTLGYTGIIDGDGILRGDLIINGQGDPTLGSKYFKDHYKDFLASWAKACQKAGIKRVEGDIIANTNFIDDESVPHSWIYEDLGNYFGAGVSSLTCFDNQYKIVFKSGAIGSTAKVIRTIPSNINIQLENHVKAGDIKRDDAWVFGAPNSNKQTIRGMIPANRESFSIKAAVPSPPQMLSDSLIQKLKKINISVSGKTICKNMSKQLPDYKTIATTKSPKLSEIIVPMNTHSINLFAEHLLITVGQKLTNATTFEEASKAVINYWKKKGIDTKGWFMEDGSGLSRANSIKSNTLCSILNYMSTQSMHKKSFWNSFSKMGKSGTAQYYYKNESFAENMRVKTGSMTRVRNITGEFVTSEKDTVIFTIMANNYSGSYSTLLTQFKPVFEKIDSQKFK